MFALACCSFAQRCECSFTGTSNTGCCHCQSPLSSCLQPCSHDRGETQPAARQARTSRTAGSAARLSLRRFRAHRPRLSCQSQLWGGLLLFEAMLQASTSGHVAGLTKLSPPSCRLEHWKKKHCQPRIKYLLRPHSFEIEDTKRFFSLLPFQCCSSPCCRPHPPTRCSARASSSG